MHVELKHNLKTLSLFYDFSENTSSGRLEYKKYFYSVPIILHTNITTNLLQIPKIQVELR